MGYQDNEKNPLLVVVPLGTQGSDITLPAGLVPYKSLLKGAWIQDKAGIAASNTDYAVMQLKNGSTVLASYDTRAAGQGALAANVGKAMSLTSALQEIAAGSSLTLDYNETDTGTAVTLTSAVLVLHLVQKQSGG